MALGSPVWLSLGIAAAAVILAVYVSLWAVFGALAVCALFSLPACAFFAARGCVAAGLAFLSAGLAILMFFGCKAATGGILRLTKEFTLWMKNCFIKKEGGQ